jgi:hypothetical protein
LLSATQDAQRKAHCKTLQRSDLRNQRFAFVVEVKLKRSDNNPVAPAASSSS